MIDIACSHCNCNFQGYPVAVSQILRCPQCGECVIVPAVTAAEGTDRISAPISRKPVWKWRDIIVGLLLPIVIYRSAFIFSDFLFYDNPWMSLVWIVAVILIFSCFSLWIYHRRVGRLPFRRIGLKDFFKESGWAFLCVICYWLVFMLIQWALYLFWGYEDPAEWVMRYDFFRFNNFVYVAILIYLFTFTPFYEELYFRGFFYNALKNRTHWIIAIIIQSLFFAIIHRYNLFGFSMVFLLGILFVLLYEYRKRLLTPILAHAQINFINTIFLLMLFVMNYHAPAESWGEAKIRPEWLCTEPPAYVEKMESGEAQRLYAIDTWGSQGSRLWKKEMNAFNAVLIWFPEDQVACARTKLGMVVIYAEHLRDHRRVVLEADDLLKNYGGDHEINASVWMYKAYAYYNLGDYEKCRESAKVVLSDYKKCEYEVYQAEYLLGLLAPEQIDITVP